MYLTTTSTGYRQEDGKDQESRVKGLISPGVSLVYATLLGIAGFMLLWFAANFRLLAGVMGFVVHVGVYSQATSVTRLRNADCSLRAQRRR
ncbi:hypothetical protein KCP76_15965 [Salmonella enterica subsp. enterica serovar Weltevreden]|nr:hypothetical protein KCP76_15965 [Salmonella enterica subsp. enterica serovar Weltevreden]